MAVAAVYLVLLSEGKILLSRRANTGYEDGNYGLVAGHVEPGETLRQAMAREALEEAGLVIAEADIDLALTMHRLSASSKPKERLDFFMTAAKYTGELTNQEPQKCSDLAWFGRSNPPENLIAYIREALNLIAEDVRYCEYGW
jgi:8-oxo-dGTP pyrophosphatase MutT (NUDIX family)